MCFYFQKYKDILLHSTIQFLTQKISIYILLSATDFTEISLDVPIMSLIVKENPELCIAVSRIVSLVSYSGSFFCISFSFMITFQRVQGSQFVEYPSRGLCWMLPYMLSKKPCWQNATWCQFVPILLVTSVLITWLKWCLLSFFTVKHLFPLFANFIKQVEKYFIPFYFLKELVQDGCEHSCNCLMDATREAVWNFLCRIFFFLENE